MGGERKKNRKKNPTRDAILINNRKKKWKTESGVPVLQ